MTLASGPILACGVDFGMTTSSLGVATTADGVRLIEDPEVPAGVRHDIPTALCFGSDNKIYIGTDAVRTAGSSPEGYVDNFKRNVGEPQPIYLRGRPFAVEEMIGFILRFLRDQGNMLGAAQAVRTALTAPSVWTDAKKKVLQSAAEAAGFDMGTLSLEEEPVAAYEYVRTLGPVEENRPVLVYDLGGGTFDCALLRPAPSGGAQTLLRDGLPRLGGVDFDYAVKDELASRYPQVREFLNAGLNRQAELGLMASCEAIKKRLSRSPYVTVQVDLRPAPPLIVECTREELLMVECTREDFDRRIAPLVDATIEVCDRILDHARLRWRDLQAIVPVGGSSAVPLVREALNRKAVGKVIDVPEPELAVVRGATMLARAATVRRRGKAPSGIAKPLVWSPVARPTEAPVVIDNVRPSAASLRPALIWLWILLVAWVGDQGTLAFRHWQELGWWTIAGCCVAAVTAAAVSTARRRFPAGLDAIVVIATVVAGIISFVVTAVYFYRSWIEGHGGYGLLGLWSLSAGILAWITAGVEIYCGATARQEIVSQDRAEKLARIADEIRKPQWFGRKPSPPRLFEPLLKLPALRAFELSAGQGPGFRYALAAGSCVVFVHESTSEDDRPRLDATLDSWRAAFGSSQRTVTLRAVILLPGQRVPDITADEALKLGAILATERTFVDTVGPLLDDQDKVYVSIAERLLEKTAAAPR